MARAAEPAVGRPWALALAVGAPFTGAGTLERGTEREVAGRYEYRVVELREKMVGGKMSGDKLQQVLNDEAAAGWRLKTITTAEIKGRVGPGGVDGVLITFEREVM